MSTFTSAVATAVGAGVFCVFTGGALTGLFTLGSAALTAVNKGLTTHADYPVRNFAMHHEPKTGLLAPMGHEYNPRTIG